MINKKEIQTVITLFCLFFLLFGIIGCTGDGDTPPSPPSEEGKCELENPDPIEEEYECETSCSGSCLGDWHLEEFGSCTYPCPGIWPWQWFRRCDGGYCCPDECDDMNGYVCEEGKICPDDWLFPLAGEDKDKCCSVECVLPCGNYDDKTSSTSGLNYCTELELDLDDLMNDLETDMNSAGVQALIDEGGIAICLDICFDLKYAVEGESEDSTWCQECAEPPAEKCCIYCPPQTVPNGGCGPTKATSCGEASGLPYSDPMQGGSAASYVENGFSVCQTECAEITGSLENIWTGTNIGEGNQWCKEMYGGTDYEDNVKCCAYCPPKTVYSNGECKSCECEPGENLTVTLDCPYVLLSWNSEENVEYYKDVADFNIRPFYDDDNDKAADGFCKEVKTTRMEYAYNLELSECTDHLQHNIRFLISPSDTSLKSILTDWIDVSICNIGGKIENCINGIDDDGDGLKDCEDSYDCPDGTICNLDGTKVCQDKACLGEGGLEICTNNIDDDNDGLADCADTEDCQEGAICDEDGTKTCQDGVCKLEEEHNFDLTGINDDFDGDGIINEDDSDKDGDGVPNIDDNEEWTPLGCEVDDYGVAIDKDGDGICKGLDCKDNDNSIKITKDDDACTREMLCSNEELDDTEIEIDLGGLCRPYIKLVQPKYGVSEESPFDIIISTDHDATCKFRDEDVKYENMLPFSSSESSKIHTKTDFSLGEGETAKFYVRCDDNHWDPDEFIVKFELSVDSSKPVITTAKADDIIEIPLQTLLVIETDDETICKYDPTEQEYDSMNNKFSGFDEPEFKKDHTQTIKIDDDTSKDYTYYVVCENRAGLISDKEDIIFRVDLNEDLIITSTTPMYTNESKVSLSIKTNKNAECYYNNVSADIDNPFGASGYEHKKLLPQLGEGHHNYYVKCYRGITTSIKDIEFNIDTATVEIPEVDDTSTIDEYPGYSYLADEIRVKWELDEKPLSGIDYYLYMLEDELGNITIDWTESDEEDKWIWIDEDHNGDELNLTNGIEYFFSVIAKNRAGSSSQAGRSDGVKIDTSKKPEECDDFELNGKETSMDCGGGECPKCELNKDCLVNDDCFSGFCNASKKCAKSSCDDGIKNGDETDVDCGGSCKKCDNDEDCKKDSDCKSGKCDSTLKICIGFDTCDNNKLDDDETDVDCGGYCAEKKDKKCDDGQDCKKPSDCESGRCDNGKCTASVKDTDKDGIPDKDDNCKHISNSDQEDTDGDGIGDACDNDNDNDEMPDEWEEDYDLDPFFDDANEDEDNDGLTNLQEYKEGTDPTNPDTDGDGVSDGKEVEKEFDPTDPDSRPASIFPIILLIIGIILLVSGIGYLLYKNFTKPKQKKPFKPFTPGSPIRPTTSFKPFTPGNERSIEFRRRQAMEKIKRDRERFREHDKVFGTFAAQPKTNISEKLHGRLDISKPKVTKTKSAPKTKTTKKISIKKKEKSPKDVFEKLSLVATAELKKYNKKDKKK